MLISHLPPVKRATAVYDTQKLYGERIKAFKQEGPPVVQGQADMLTISQAGTQSLAMNRPLKEEKKPLTYSNPRLDNNREITQDRRSLSVPLLRAAV